MLNCVRRRRRDANHRRLLVGLLLGELALLSAFEEHGEGVGGDEGCPRSTRACFDVKRSVESRRKDGRCPSS
jgi:hypothetical protein